ncbi:MAG: restriction endonuclease [Armatimonadetes bacterium]|nr:restriction endonuclease [Armatimonadota bacterium]
MWNSRPRCSPEWRQPARSSSATSTSLGWTTSRYQLTESCQEVFDNRVGWARTYLTKAGLLNKTRRGHYEISQAGLDALATKPSRIDVKFLERYEEFREFRALKGTRSGTGTGAEPPDQDQQTTPEEALEFAYSRLRDSLASDIIQQVKAASPSLFERLVVELLLKMGYGGSRQDAGRAIGRSGDEGIDGIINEDRLGLDIIYIQAKRWEAGVGRPEVQKFAGALQGQRAIGWFRNEAPPQGTH